MSDLQIDARFPAKLKGLWRPARYKVMHGGRGCLHPDTLIDTPNGQVKVKDFTGGLVYSWDNGRLVTRYASPAAPFTIEDLYEVRLANGSSIIATDEHKFLTARGWKRLADLSRCEDVVVLSPSRSRDRAQTSSLEPLSVWRKDGPRLTETLSGYQASYSTCFHRYGRRLREVAETFLSFVRPLADAPQHIRHAWTRTGALGCVDTDTPLRPSRPPSTQVFPLDAAAQCCVETGSCTGEISFARLLGFFQSRLRFRAKASLAMQAHKQAKPHLGFLPFLCLGESQKTLRDKLARVSLCDSSQHLDSAEEDFTLTQVASICYHSRQTYWDLSVESTENYLSNGIVNHNSGKSWAAARALLIMALEKPLRVLCAREVQKSLKESVKALLVDQIQEMGLGGQYLVLEAEIRGANGSRFIFSGLATHTVESIKSYESVDICWVEEAQTVSKRSWDILTPTIRRPGSEIWMTLNPWLATDETYQRFVLDPPPESWTCAINFSDNPWFPDVLEAERADCERRRPKEEYENIWLGMPRRTADGAYYAEQMQALRAAGRIREVPYQSNVPVNTFWDLGWNDTTAIWWHQYVAGEDRFLRAYEMSGESLDHYVQIIQSAGYVYDTHYLPHDAENRSLQTGKSVREILEELIPGHRFEVVPRTENVLTGIHETRMRLAGPVYFDARECERGIVSLENYRKKYNERLEVFTDQPLHDQYSNLADAFRQWGQGFRGTRVTSSRPSRARSWRAS